MSRPWTVAQISNRQGQAGSQTHGAPNRAALGRQLPTEANKGNEERPPSVSFVLFCSKNPGILADMVGISNESSPANGRRVVGT